MKKLITPFVIFQVNKTLQRQINTQIKDSLPLILYNNVSSFNYAPFFLYKYAYRISSVNKHKNELFSSQWSRYLENNIEFIKYAAAKECRSHWRSDRNHSSDRICYVYMELWKELINTSSCKKQKKKISRVSWIKLLMQILFSVSSMWLWKHMSVFNSLSCETLDICEWKWIIYIFIF